MIRDQMKKPYHVFTNTDSLWAFYNYVTIALQTSHPKTWMEDQRVLHYFISSINNFAQAPAVVVVPEVEEEVAPVVHSDPNQTNLLDQIAEIEATEDIDRNITIDEEVEEYEVQEVQEDKVCDETVIYTDPIGNAFEVPVVIDSIELNTTTKAAVIVVENAEDTEQDEFAAADNFDLDFNEETNEDPDSIPDFF
jgi:hypothetical protein